MPGLRLSLHRAAVRTRQGESRRTRQHFLSSQSQADEMAAAAHWLTEASATRVGARQHLAVVWVARQVAPWLEAALAFARAVERPQRSRGAVRLRLLQRLAPGDFTPR